MARQGGQEDCLLQLSETRTCHCRLPGEQSKAHNLKKPYKKKVLKATWDLKSESKEEVDTAHVCFVANENTSKITFEFYLDECELSMEALVEAFEELYNNYDFFKKNIWKWKQNELLQNQIVVLFKDKRFYLPHSKTHKRILMRTKFLIRLYFLLLIKMRFSLWKIKLIL